MTHFNFERVQEPTLAPLPPEPPPPPVPHAAGYFRSAAEHPSSAAVLRYFQFAHLPEGPLRDTSKAVAELAEVLAGDFPPSAEFTAGLRKLLEIGRAHV